MKKEAAKKRVKEYYDNYIEEKYDEIRQCITNLGGFEIDIKEVKVIIKSIILDMNSRRAERLKNHLVNARIKKVT